MRINAVGLPTHIAMVGRRINTCGEDKPTDAFLYSSYLAEAAIKTVGVVLQSGVGTASPDAAYRLGYRFIHSDGLGEWEDSLREAAGNLAGYYSRDFRPLLAWLTEKRKEDKSTWFAACKAALNQVLDLIDVEPESVARFRRTRTSFDLLAGLVYIRNKTKAHGAFGANFYGQAAEPYCTAVSGLVTDCPVFSWRWVYLSAGHQGVSKGTWLTGDAPSALSPQDQATMAVSKPGVYFLTHQHDRPRGCGGLIVTDLELSEFYLPNGGFSDDGRAEFINYANGKTERMEVPDFVRPPAPLPASETEGAFVFDIQSNVLGNLPSVPHGYVERRVLQDELELRLRDRNHHIITLHGWGGLGKTSLALFVAHKLASEQEPPFEYVIWFSARDIDLRPSGPVIVRPAETSLEAIAKRYGTLFEVGPTMAEFSKVLESPAGFTNKGILLIFDNFETNDDVIGIYKFLDTHTRLPNKVLLTSRERKFKADFPIEVKGMEWEEAHAMMTALSRELSIEGILDTSLMQSIYNRTEGHPYIMRVIVGEIAKEGRPVPYEQLIPRRQDIVDAVFDRSFNRLSDDGRWVFLTLANWRSWVVETALLVALAQEGRDADAGVEECVRLSLVIKDYRTSDDEPVYWTPKLARDFGRKKLMGDPDQLAVKGCIELMQHFGPATRQRALRSQVDEIMRPMLAWCIAQAKANSAQVQRYDLLLERVAHSWPAAWSHLARYRHLLEPANRDGVDYALRRAVEEAPSKDVWRERAKFAKLYGDEQTYVASLLSAADADPTDIGLLSEVATELARYVTNHKQEIPVTRRSVYLASVRAHMERLSSKLNPYDLGKLAWLFLLEGNKAQALLYASQGYAKDRQCEPCLRIVEDLRDDA